MLNIGNAIAKSAQYALEKPAPFLRYTTAAAFGISTVAQSAGLYANKSIEKKEKNFLIIQEVVNGVLELATFMTIATKLEKLGEKLATEGKIVSKTLANNSPAFIKGVTMFASVLGTVLAFNLVTPLIRNPVTSLIQKMAKKKGPEAGQQNLAKPQQQLANTVQFDKNNPFASFEHNSKIQKPVSFSATGMKI